MSEDQMMLMKDWGVFHKSPPPAEWEGPDVMFFSNASDDDWYRSIAHVKDPDFVTVIVDDATAKVIAAHRDPSALVPLDARVLTFTDTGQDTEALRGMIWNGLTFEDPAPPPEPVPEITQRQLRLWLVRNGYSLAAVEAVIDGLPEPARTEAQIEWEFASKFDPSHATLLAVAAALGIADIAQAAREAALI